MTGRVLHTGQAIVDVVMRVAAMPPVGGDVFASDSAFTAGGGFNVMAAAARDGGEVVYLGATGDGPFGTIVRDALAAERISTPAPPVTGQDTGYCVAIVDDDAERTFVSYLGAEGHVTLDDLTAVEVRSDDVVYVTGYSLLHGTNRASLLAWLPTLPEGTRVVFDPSPLVDEIPDDAWTALVEGAWLWTLNAREAGLALNRLARVAAGDPGSSTMAEDLADRLGRRVLLRCGGEGAYLADPGTPGTPARRAVHVPGFPVVPVDTNGAGDAHTGVLAAALARGVDLAAAVPRANAAAALAITRPGPATSPDATEIDALVGGTR